MITETCMRFADKLKELRAARGWTQQQLASQARIPVWTLRGFEQGKSSPSWGAVVKLARAFDSHSGLFDDCDEVAEPSPAPPVKRPRKRD